MEAGVASFASVARISPTKNVHWLVRLFEEVEGAAILHLVGPLESDCWREIADSIDLLPPNATVDHVGPIHPSKVSQVLLDSDFFILPTLGENFGHAISESLRVGRPTLISERTPWSEAGSDNDGWVMDPADINAWTEAIAACMAMDSGEYLECSRSALRWAQGL